MNGAAGGTNRGNSTVKDGGYASGISGGM